jgi:hypothetical protein
MSVLSHGRRIAVTAAAFISFFSSSVSAQQPPREGCRAVSKIEYDSAQRNHLLRTRFGMYERTGRVLRRKYWYCH